MKSPGLFLLLALAFAGCGGPAEQAGKTVFHYNESVGISSLDPAYARNLENMWAVNQVFDGLVELNADLEVVPLLARTWDVSDSGRTYTFHLRDDVFFHADPNLGPARKLVASDVVYSFNRILDPEVASPGKWIFGPVDTDRGGFEALNDSTLNIYLRQPFPPFLGMLATQYCNVVSPEAVAHYGADFRSHPVGTGPFQFAHWVEDVALVFHKNPSFWQTDATGAPLPYLDAVKIDFVRDMSVEYLGLLKGEYDFMSGLHPAYKDELLTPDGQLSPTFEDRLKLQTTPFLKTDYLGILVDDSLEVSANHPLHDARVRRALSMAVNRADMVRYLRNNAVVPADGGFVPKGMAGHAGGDVLFDVEAAKALLAEAGYPSGQGIPPIDITTTSDYVDLCEFVQFAWRGLGLQVTVDVQQGATHRENVAQSRALVFRKSWLADYADAENFLGLFHSGNFAPNGPNYTHYSNPQFDAWYDQAIAATTDTERTALYQRMDSLVRAESPVIPLFYDQVTHFVGQRVEGLQTNGVNMLDLKWVSVRD